MIELVTQQLALVRILVNAVEPRRAVGAGFLVSPRHILTCAHVVADALGIPRDTPTAPADPVWLDAPLVEGCVPVTARVLTWYPVKESATLGELEDIAVLELESEQQLPPEAQPLPLVILKGNAFFDRSVRICGFPTSMDGGDWVNGQLQGPIATGWIQLDHELGRRGVAPGFSGTAVWDKQENAVMGMIVSIQTRTGETSAYLIPVITLIKAWPELDVHSRPPNPYRGLEAFREQDAPYFLGRDSDIQDLRDAVQDHSMVTVIGASGSGKSSLVFAGLVPHLRKDDHWLIADFRPKGDPLGELATALAPLLYPTLDKLERRKKRNQLLGDLAEGGLSLADVIAILRQENPGKRLLLITDQFEELYTQNSPEDRQHQFLDGLLAAVQSQSKFPELTLLLIIRADFLGQALNYEPFARALDAYPKKILGPLSETALETVTEEPARQLGVVLEHGLTERIFQDLGQEPPDCGSGGRMT